MTELLEALFLLLMAIIATYIIRHYIFTLTAIKNAKNPNLRRNDGSSHIKVSILIPARNEEKVIERILQRMTQLTYPKNEMQVIVINDASTDRTGEIADKFAKNYDYIRVLHRNVEDGGGKGKTSALNTGLKLVDGEIVFCFDADYYPQRDIIENLSKEFNDPKVGAVQGRVIVLNEPYSIVTRLIALERTGGYRVDQEARDILGLVTQYGGTAGGIRRSLLEQLGGWDENVLAEDTELTMRVYLAGYKIRYVNEAECYEEAVENWKAYRKQRYRWAKGHMQCAFKHWLNVIKSDKLSVKQKIDTLLLLNVYFMPVLVLLSWITGIVLFLFSSTQWMSTVWTLAPFSVYSFIGNFAPFYEVGVGAQLDGRTRAQWLISLLVFAFLYNIPICTKALVDLLFSKIKRKNDNHWTKTDHSGNGNTYITI